MYKDDGTFYKGHSCLNLADEFLFCTFKFSLMSFELIFMPSVQSCKLFKCMLYAFYFITDFNLGLLVVFFGHIIVGRDFGLGWWCGAFSGIEMQL